MAMAKPTKKPSVTTWAPRWVALEISDCHTGMVAVYPPVPKPRTIRATMNWAIEKDDAMRMAPIMDVAVAMKMVRRRPRGSPSLMQAKAPNAAPSV